MAVASSDRKKVLSITMQAVDKMSPALKALVMGIKGFKAVATTAFKAITLPVRLLHSAISALLSPIGLLRAAIGFVAARGLAGFFTGAAEAGDKIDELSIGLDMNRQTLQEWDYVAKLSGSSIETLGNSWIKMGDAIADAADGSDSTSEAFRKLGLDAKAMKQLRPEEQFQAIADAMDGIAGQTERIQIIRDIFGRAGGELLRILNQGGAAIRAMREEAQGLGLLDEKDIANLVKFQDSIDGIKFLFGNLRNTIAAEFSPMLEKMLTGVKNFIKDNLPQLKEGAREVAHSIEFAARSVVAFRELWSRLFNDQGETATLGKLLNATGTLAIDTAEDTVAAIIEIFVRGFGVLVVPAGNAALDIGKVVAQRFGEGFLPTWIGFWNGIVNNPLVEHLTALTTGMSIDRVRQANAEMQALEQKWMSNRTLNTGADWAHEFAEVGRNSALEFKLAWQDQINEGGPVWFDLEKNFDRFQASVNELGNESPAVAAFLTQIKALKAEIFGVADAITEVDAAADTAAAKQSTVWSGLKEQASGFWQGFKDQSARAWEAMNDHGARGAAAFDGIFGAWNAGLDSMIDRAFEGTLNIADAFKEMGKEILKVIAKIMAQEIALGIVRAIFGSPATSVASARGNVFDQSSLVPFAKGGVINEPKIFPMAKGGLGLMGEAGPEAIMPLRRDRQGRLGVSAGGEGGGTVIQHHNYYNINAIDVQSFRQALAKEQRTFNDMMVSGVNESGRVRSQIKQRTR